MRETDCETFLRDPSVTKALKISVYLSYVPFFLSDRNERLGPFVATWTLFVFIYRLGCTRYRRIDLHRGRFSLPFLWSDGPALFITAYVHVKLRGSQNEPQISLRGCAAEKYGLFHFCDARKKTSWQWAENCRLQKVLKCEGGDFRCSCKFLAWRTLQKMGIYCILPHYWKGHSQPF